MAETIKAETVITGHANADFDCLAAIVAAGKLYDHAALIFPGSQEKTLRNFFIQSATYLFNFVSSKEVDAESVKRVVVVDTRQASRLDHVRQFLEKPGIKIHLYDHHPDSDDDLAAEYSEVKHWGSTTAILVDKIKAKNIPVNPEEATIMGLGIYEDTGSFTFNSTTCHDLEAAAWLRSRDMDLNVISDLLTRDLTADQVAILSSLLESATTHDINGVEVVLAEASSESYVGDFALLVHKMMDMQNIRVLFALGRMQDRLTLVARSRAPEVDVGRICESFGGGGHGYAASASIKDRTLAQTKEELFALLYSTINPQLIVSRFMSRPPVPVAEGATIAQAAELMTRYGFKAVPVVDKPGGACVGILEHQIADKAMAHGLGKVQVSEYMMRRITTTHPESDLYEAMEIIISQRQRLVPVVSGGELAGVLTRTDLINLFIEEPARIPEYLLPDKKRERNITRLMRDRLPKDIFSLLATAGELAEELSHQVYVVGGFVRDILLSRPNLDVDLVVEGDGIAFARRLAKRLGGRVKPHHKFKTAVVILPDDSRVDVATARLEYYAYPAALPTVQLSSIKMDLYRRDFTINALAVHLNPDSFGRLVDFFGAQRDIKERVVRVLHSLSFVEDPTRIFRAIRFEQRFDFHIGGQTERLIKNAVQMKFFDRLSGSRIFNELRQIFEEKNAIKCLRRMSGFRLLRLIHPKLTLNQRKETLIRKLESVLDWYGLLYTEPKPQPWRLYFMALSWGMEEDEVSEMLTRLSISKSDHREFLYLRSQVGKSFGELVQWLSNSGPMSELYFYLEELPLEGSLFLMARSTKEPMRKSISTYLARLKDMKLDIGGNDLKELGIPPGPVYGDILKKVMAAKIDGRAECREDQIELAKRLADPLPPRAPKKPPKASQKAS